MYTCLNLIVVKNVTFNTSKAVKKDGIKDGDQMKLTTARLKKLIREELSKMNEQESGKEVIEDRLGRDIEYVIDHDNKKITRIDLNIGNAPEAVTTIDYSPEKVKDIRSKKNKMD